MQADMRVLRIGPEELWVELESVALAAASKHLETYKVGRDVEIVDRGDEVATVSLLGPAAAEVAGAGPLGPEHAHRELEVGSAPCRAIATDLGIDLVANRAELGALTEALAAAGATRVSEDAAEVLRVESGRPRYGAEMGPSTIPAEAGIVERAIDFEKGCYIGQETVARLHYKGKPNRSLRGLRLSAPAAAGDPLRLGERELGTVGTACISPANGPIALAIVRREASPGDTIEVGEAGARAEVVELPFSAA
jgi:folate-binding protein YgfZ